MRFALGAALVSLAAGQVLAAFSPPAQITVVSDDNYPPYLFRDGDGRLQGILKDKWELWSRKTGVAAKLEGMDWAKAQQTLLGGGADVIDAISYTEARAPLYEFSPAWGTVETRVFFHRSISGINDARSMRGFAVGTKDGSACTNWLKERGVEAIRSFPNTDAMVTAAGSGEIRLFCMDAPAAKYFFFKRHIAGDFRETAPLYEARYYWAVARGKAELRDFIQQGFERIGTGDLREIDERWQGNPLTLPIDARYFYYFAFAVAAVLAAAALLLLWNRTLRRQVLARTDHLRQMTQRLASVEETERRNINRELHDRVGQNLSALQLSLGTLRLELARGAPPAVDSRLDDAQSLLEMTSSQVRDVMAELRPAALDDYGLLAAVRQHAGAVAARAGIALTVEGSEIEPRLPPTTETTLFRIAQEALNNTAKHAGARNMKIILASTPDRARLSIVDDGAGFDAARPAAGSSYGVITMQERAEAVGARLRIHSAPGKGTRVDIQVAQEPHVTIRVLLADDHAMVREGLRALLAASGIISVVGEVSDGREAVRRAAELLPDVVVMDVSMPGLNGIEAVNLIRAKCPGAKFVVLSMHSSTEHVYRAFAAGATGYVLKSSASREVIAAIQAVHAGQNYLSPALRQAAADASPRVKKAGPLDSLSSRERQVLQLVVEGQSSAAIARTVHLSPKTVDTYRSRIMKKLGVSDLASLVKFALQHGITPSA